MLPSARPLVPASLPLPTPPFSAPRPSGEIFHAYSPPAASAPSHSLLGCLPKAPHLVFVPSAPYNVPIDEFGPAHSSSSPNAHLWSENPVTGPWFSTPTAYPRPDPHHASYDPRPDGSYSLPYASLRERITCHPRIGHPLRSYGSTHSPEITF